MPLSAIDAIKTAAYIVSNFTMNRLPTIEAVKTGANQAANFAVNSLPSTDAVKAAAYQVSNYTINTLPTSDTVKTAASQASNITVNYAREHPYSTAFSVTSLALTPLLGSGWMLKPVAKLLGMGIGGPVGGMKISFFVRKDFTDCSCRFYHYLVSICVSWSVHRPN